MKPPSFLIASLVLIGALCAQEPRITVQARFVPAKAAPGQTVLLEVRASVQAGYHVYGALEPNGTPIDLEFSVPDALRREGSVQIPDGTKHETMGIESYWIEGLAVLKQAFLVPEGAAGGKVELKGVVAYTACTEAFCEPPSSEPFTAVLEVEGKQPPDPGGAKPVADPLLGLGAPPGLAGKLAAKKVQLVRAAFTPKKARAGETVTLSLQVATVPGWHVYGAGEATGIPIKVIPSATGGLVANGETQVPQGHLHEQIAGFPSFWLEGAFELTQQWRVPKHTPAGEIVLRGEISYQPCDPEKCLEVESIPFSSRLEIEPGKARAAYVVAARAAPSSGGMDATLEAIATGNLITLLLLSIGAGLFALVMPCTYPMIPITFSFFTKQADERGGHVLPLALTYGAGIVTIFVLIGLLIGPAIVPFAQAWITNLIIGSLFVVLALSLFGVINLEPPRFLTGLMGKTSGRGGYAGVFLMGATLVVATFTCTIPFLSSVLSTAAQTGKLAYVALSMAVFGLTMAVPFVVLSLVPGKVKALPRSGEWMHVLKVFLGFVELAAALKFFSNADLVLKTNLISRSTFLWVWAAVFFVAGLFLLQLLGRHLAGRPRLGLKRKLGGFAAVAFSVYCSFGAVGNRLDFIMTAMAPPYKKFLHEVVLDDYEAALGRAREEKKLLFINFTGFT